jgi:two-component system chemotaxis response regulator CheB
LLRALPVNLRPPEILVIGASTGGPQAVQLFLKELKGRWRTPIVVVQHMPEAFIELLAQQLGKASGLPVLIPGDGTVLLPGRVYLASGDFHLRVTSIGGQAMARLDQGPMDNHCRPSVNALFRSVAAAYGDRALGVVLTGMGRDGCDGAQAIAEAGGVVIAQDEASSVVWGMPGAVAKAGLACIVRSVEDLAAAALLMAAGERP